MSDESDGRVRVKVTYAAAGQEPKFDQVVAGLVQDGTFDLGIVPARSWDDLGVTSLRALQAPFLLDSDELVDEVVRGDLVEPLLAGLEGTGVRGLALWPESMRHPVGFGTPLLSLAEFRGAGIRAPYSRDVFAMIRALGGQPLDLSAKAMNAGYAAGRVAGAEAGADVVFGPPATITADVTLYGKIDTLVVADEAWGRLSDQARTALGAAALSTRDWLVADRARETELLGQACVRGSGVALAGAAAVAEIERATSPVLEALKEDPEIGATIEKIETLKTAVDAEPVVPAECQVQGPAADIGPEIDPAVLDGTYRTEFTSKELLAAGADGDCADSCAGNWTITLDGGHYSDVESDCTGTYQVSETMISFRWDPYVVCSGDWSAQWELTEDGSGSCGCSRRTPVTAPCGACTSGCGSTSVLSG